MKYPGESGSSEVEPTRRSGRARGAPLRKTGEMRVGAGLVHARLATPFLILRYSAALGRGSPWMVRVNNSLFVHLIPILQLAIAPVILISGVGLLLLTLTNRFGCVLDRAALSTAMPSRALTCASRSRSCAAAPRSSERP